MPLRLLQSLFRAAPTTASHSFDDALIRAAIERVVEGADPRLRAVPNYQRKLRDAVAHSIAHVAQQVAMLPPALELSRRRFTLDPHVRALFVSPDHLREVLSASMRQDQGQAVAARLPDGSAEIYAVLRMERTEKTVLGVGMQGDLIQRDVPQTLVNFSDHRIAFPNASEAETRREMMKRGFDYLIEAALDRLAAIRSQKQQLQHQRQLLQKKARVLKTAQPGLEALLEDRAGGKTVTSATVERQLAEIEAEFNRLQADSATIDHHLEKVIATLRQPEQYLRLGQVALTLNQMNVKVSGDAAKTASTLNFNDCLIGAHRRLTVLLVRFSRSELLPEQPEDFFEEAQRLLYLNGRPRLTTL